MMARQAAHALTCGHKGGGARDGEAGRLAPQMHARGMAAGREERYAREKGGARMGGGWVQAVAARGSVRAPAAKHSMQMQQRC